MMGRCFQVVDLGTQTFVFSGHLRHLRRIMISWETPGGVRSKNYTRSSAPNATLTRDLGTWKCGLDDVLGRWAQLTVLGEHVLQVLPGSPAWDPERKLRRFDIEHPDMAVFADLPPRVRAMIEKAPEWRG